MASTFDQKSRELGRMVGDGKLVGKVVVDQVYALAIHSGYWRTGPLAGVTNRPRHGGQAHFLSEPLELRAPVYMQRLADHVLGGATGHIDLAEAMRKNMEDLSDQVYFKAPRDKNVLRDSSRVQVFDHGELVRDRPPKAERLK